MIDPITQKSRPQLEDGRAGQGTCGTYYELTTLATRIRRLEHGLFLATEALREHIERDMRDPGTAPESDAETWRHGVSLLDQLEVQS